MYEGCAVYIDFVKTYLCFACVQFNQPEYSGELHRPALYIQMIIYHYYTLEDKTSPFK